MNGNSKLEKIPSFCGECNSHRQQLNDILMACPVVPETVQITFAGDYALYVRSCFAALQAEIERLRKFEKELARLKTDKMIEIEVEYSQRLLEHSRNANFHNHNSEDEIIASSKKWQEVWDIIAAERNKKLHEVLS